MKDLVISNFEKLKTVAHRKSSIKDDSLKKCMEPMFLIEIMVKWKKQEAITW